MSDIYKPVPDTTIFSVIIQSILNLGNGFGIKSGAEVTATDPVSSIVNIASGELVFNQETLALSANQLDLASEINALAAGHSQYVLVVATKNGTTIEFNTVSFTSTDTGILETGESPQNAVFLALVKISAGSSITNSDIENIGRTLYEIPAKLTFADIAANVFTELQSQLFKLLSGSDEKLLVSWDATNEAVKLQYPLPNIPTSNVENALFLKAFSYSPGSSVNTIGVGFGVIPTKPGINLRIQKINDGDNDYERLITDLIGNGNLISKLIAANLASPLASPLTPYLVPYLKIPLGLEGEYLKGTQISGVLSSGQLDADFKQQNLGVEVVKAIPSGSSFTVNYSYTVSANASASGTVNLGMFYNDVTLGSITFEESLVIVPNTLTVTTQRSFTKTIGRAFIVGDIIAFFNNFKITVVGNITFRVAYKVKSITVVAP